MQTRSRLKFHYHIFADFETKDTNVEFEERVSIRSARKSTTD